MQPTDAQKEAGNYKKRHISWRGLSISIENEKGSIRSGTSPNGKRWSVRMPAAYGYIKGTEGADGDHVDVYLGPRHESNVVFVVDQIDPASGNFDEHKCLLGYDSEREAIKTYDAGFSDASGPRRRSHVEPMSVERFKQWLKDCDTRKRIAGRKFRASGGSTVSEHIGPDEEQGIFHGPLHSDVAGRTDHLPLHTKDGAYVIPAYAVSHLGENNTTAGLKLLKRVFGGIPYSREKSPYGKEKGAYDSGAAPYGQSGVYGQELQPRAKGGKTSGTVPVVVAGGEYIVSPEVVAAIGDGDIATGHTVLDKFVEHIKKEHINTLKKLPGPKR